MSLSKDPLKTSPALRTVYTVDRYSGKLEFVEVVKETPKQVKTRETYPHGVGIYTSRIEDFLRIYSPTPKLAWRAAAERSVQEINHLKTSLQQARTKLGMIQSEIKRCRS